MQGYIVTEKNASVISHITGRSLPVIQANIGWVAAELKEEGSTWFVLPKSYIDNCYPDFCYLTLKVDEPQGRTIDDIRAEIAELNRTYYEKVQALAEEMLTLQPA